MSALRPRPRLASGLSTRVALVALASALLAALAGTLISRALVRQLTAESIARILHSVLTPAEIARCERDPGAWSLRGDDGAAIDAYAHGTYTPARASSGPLDPDLRDELSRGVALPVRVYWSGPWGGAGALRVRAEGPCALMQARWPLRHTLRRTLGAYVLASTLAVLLATALMVSLAIVRPLRARVAALRRAARTVGEDTGYASASGAARDELEEIAESIDRAHERIAAAATALRERSAATERFLVDVMHDIRTPMTSLLLTLEELADRAASGDDTDAEGRELLRTAFADAVYISTLATNLRMADQLRAGGPTLAADATVDLAEVVRRVGAREGVFARRRGLRLAIECPEGALLARGDATMSEQALTNVVQNAIAYGDEGGAVRVGLALERGAHGDARFVLAVEDDGPGVLPADIPRLGDRAFRSDAARQRDPKGSGFGLAITRAVCERQGWTLAFAANSPRGLRVSLSGRVSERVSE